jgi:hypothetical protein
VLPRVVRTGGSNVRIPTRREWPGDREPNPAPMLLEQAADLLARPGAASRLWGYAVLRDMWGLRGWLRHARAGGNLEEWGAETHDLRTWEPWIHLQGHATRTSWLADLLC